MVRQKRARGRTAAKERSTARPLTTFGKAAFLIAAAPVVAGAAVCVWLVRRRGAGVATRIIAGVAVPAGTACGVILTRWLYLRLLGLIYLSAFLSFWVQLPGLIGKRGIVPAADWLERLQDIPGRQRFLVVPTLAWRDSSDRFLRSLAANGVLLSLLVVFGIATGPALFALWLLYLSLVSIGRPFLCFQWDALLLETGFLSIFFAPGVLLEPHWPLPLALRATPPPSVPLLCLLRLLVFRLMLSSGLVKWLSQDRTWRDLTAMSYHYETQPLPTVPAWYAAKLPQRFQKFSTACVFVLEIGVPFLMLGPRPSRMFAAWTTIGFMGLIMITGNYTFFNLLTMTLCVVLLDDMQVCRLLPRDMAARILIASRVRRFDLISPLRWPVAALIFNTAIVRMAETLGRRARFSKRVRKFFDQLLSLQLVNNYGLFAVMTTSRPEIVFEGSDDGRTWRAYEFKYKPGELKRPPLWVQPHQPRLDWQMWFAALDDYESNPWVLSFVARLLEGSAEVLALIKHNPFPDRPPRFVRALLYDYHFTDFKERELTGNWWKRELIGVYLPVMTLPDRARSTAR